MSITRVPKNAKRVFKGVIFDVYQWPQKMYDGSMATFEILKRPDTVLIIPTIGDKILIHRQKQPRMDWFYSVPAGRMDKKGESAKQAALRELLEETGLRPKRIKLWKKYITPGKIVHTVHIFIAQDCEKVAKMAPDGGEKIHNKMVTFDQFLKFSDHPEFHAGEILTDMLRARLSKAGYQRLKKTIFS
jgi:ADP-ribose pyrophosphatase